MKVTVTYTDGKKETFTAVQDVFNQDRDYRLPRFNDTFVLIPKAVVRKLEGES